MNLGLGLALPTFPLRGGIDQFIRSMFAGGEQGAWYDPSDLSTMFTDISGATPVTATGQTVGLILDKRLGATPSTADQWVDASVAFGGESTRVDATSYRILSTAGVNSNAQVVGALVVGQVYRVTFTVVSSTGVGVRVNDVGAIADAPGTYTSTFVADNTVAFIKRNGGITDTIVTDISFRLIPGNHAYQATAASRPIFRDVAGLRYLEFDGVDDYLSATYALAQPVNRISAFASATIAASDRVFDGSGGSRISLLQDPGVLYTYSGAYVGPIAIVAGTNYVITELFSGASSKLAKNNEAYATGDAGSADQIVSVIGASTGGATAANIHLHQMIMRGGTTAMTDGQIATLRALCARKAGVTL